MKYHETMRFGQVLDCLEQLFIVESVTYTEILKWTQLNTLDSSVLKVRPNQLVVLSHVTGLKKHVQTYKLDRVVLRLSPSLKLCPTKSSCGATKTRKATSSKSGRSRSL